MTFGYAYYAVQAWIAVLEASRGASVVGGTSGGGGGPPSTAGQPIGLLLILTKAS